MSDWSKAELKDAILAYKEMQERIRLEIPLVKSHVYKKLSQIHTNRTSEAFERRMQNISYILSLSGREWIDGLKPARNVGPNVMREIEELIAEIEGRNLNHSLFQKAKENDALQHIQDEVPEGKNRPERRTVQTTVHDRDSNVVAWVLRNAKGKCESCEQPAPFHTTGKIPFLEVHHVKHLADNGSDTVTNAVALCPNCHREFHYGLNSREKKNNLYLKVTRLVKE